MRVDYHFVSVEKAAALVDGGQTPIDGWVNAGHAVFFVGLTGACYVFCGGYFASIVSVSF